MPTSGLGLLLLAAAGVVLGTWMDAIPAATSRDQKTSLGKQPWVRKEETN